MNMTQSVANMKARLTRHATWLESNPEGYVFVRGMLGLSVTENYEGVTVKAAMGDTLPTVFTLSKAVANLELVRNIANSQDIEVQQISMYLKQSIDNMQSTIDLVQQYLAVKPE